MKKIIINADDYGLASGFNKGINELIEKNIVSSTTVMINKSSIDFPKLIRISKKKNISVGLHLELKKKCTLIEIEEQINKFEKFFKRKPSHLDGHCIVNSQG